MKQKTPKQFALEQAVKKARKSALNRASRLRKRGYVLPKDIVGDLPKVITEATLRRFQSYDLKYMYQRAVFISPEGVKVKGTERKKQEFSERSKKSAETRRKKYYATSEREISAKPVSKARAFFATIEDLSWEIEFSWYDRVSLWTHNKGSQSLESIKQRDANMMMAMLRDAIAKNGEEATLTRINDRAKDIYEIIDIVLLASGDSYYQSARSLEVNRKIQLFGEIVKGAPLTASESQYFSDLAEQNESYDTN